MRYKSFIFSLFFLPFCLSLEARDANPKSGSTTATELFYKVYNLVFGPQGSALSYKVNIIGLYRTEGNIIYKGKKLHYSEARYMAWEDGITA